MRNRKGFRDTSPCKQIYSLIFLLRFPLMNINLIMKLLDSFCSIKSIFQATTIKLKHVNLKVSFLFPKEKHFDAMHK